MRIISGIHKNKKLSCVDGLQVRPVTDKVKGAIFNSLQHRVNWNSAAVLDLFAGCGSLGLEAISRGAKHSTFVEENYEVCEFIRNNISQLNEANKTLVLNTSFENFLGSGSSLFDVIFADPPYAYENTLQLPKIICPSILQNNGYLFVEHLTGLEFPESDLYNIETKKRFGKTTVTYFTRKIK